jgi:Tfp pilus assembly protein PilN
MAITLERLRGGSVNVPINLLPSEVRADQRMRRVFNGVAVLAGIIVLVLVIVSVMQHRAVNSAKHDLAVETEHANQLTTQVTALAPYGQMEAQVLSTRRTLAAALLGDVQWTKFMTQLSDAIPSDSWIENVALTAQPGTTPDGAVSYGTATYNGKVTSFPGLAGWLSAMAKVSGLHFVYLGNGTKDASGVVSFSATANITPSILSGRCQTETAPCP